MVDGVCYWKLKYVMEHIGLLFYVCVDYYCLLTITYAVIVCVILQNLIRCYQFI